MKMSDSIKYASSKVQILLAKFPQLRDSDKLLWLAYLCHYHNLRNEIGLENYEKLKTIVMNEKTPTMESITRARRKIQENGLYQGNKRQERLEEEQNTRDLFSI